MRLFIILIATSFMHCFLWSCQSHPTDEILSNTQSLPSTGSPNQNKPDITDSFDRHNGLTNLLRDTSLMNSHLTKDALSILDSAIVLANKNQLLIDSLKAKLEIKQKDAEKILLKKDIEVQRFRNLILWILLLLGSVIFIVFVIFFYLRQQQVKHKVQLAEEKSIRIDQEKRNHDSEIITVRTN